MGTVILGGGISGLISGYILNAPVITREVGGQLNHPFPLGPRILEYTEETSWLLDQLGIKRFMKTYHIGYMTKLGVKDSPPEGFRERYYKKTRGLDLPSDSSMSGGRSQIVGWDLESLNLISRLEESIKIIKAYITHIDIDYVQCFKPREFEDNQNLILSGVNLVNTLPLPLFLNLSNPMSRTSRYPCSLDLNSLDTYFFKVRALKDLTQGFDYIYIDDPLDPIHRINRINEYTFILESRFLDIHKSNIHILDTKVIMGSQIIKNGKVKCFNGTTMIGRYAQWDHSVKIEDVIRRAKQYATGKMGRVY